MSSRRLWLAAAGTAVVAGSGWLFLHEEAEHKPGKPAPPATPVTTEAVASGEVPIELDALGRVLALNTVTIRTQVAGQIEKVYFKDGQSVQAGEVLVKIDPRPLQATIQQDKANIDRDRAILASAEGDLRRYIPLAQQGVVSTQQVETQRALVTQLRAAVAAGTAVLARDQVQLGFTSVTAPIAGVLGLRVMDVGNIASPADPGGLVLLTQMQPITVLFAVPQASLPEIRARVAESGADGLVVQAWTQDGSRQLDEGRLSALSNLVGAGSGTVTLKGSFPNLNQSLWPGTFVTARLVLHVQRDALTVPGAALDEGPKGSFVWTVGEDGTAKPTPVKVQQLVRGAALVSSGLQAGEQVVTDGQYGLTPGARVAVQHAATQQASNGQASTPLRSNQAGRLGISP